jgi:hypothetical protein
MNKNSKLRIQRIKCICGNYCENKIKKYEEIHEKISENLKYIKNIHEIKSVTIFEYYYEGLELLKNAEKITIILQMTKIDEHYKHNKKMTNRIKKLQKINTQVDIEMISDTLFYYGSMHLIMCEWNSEWNEELNKIK